MQRQLFLGPVTISDLPELLRLTPKDGYWDSEWTLQAQSHTRSHRQLAGHEKWNFKSAFDLPMFILEARPQFDNFRSHSVTDSSTAGQRKSMHYQKCSGHRHSSLSSWTHQMYPSVKWGDSWRKVTTRTGNELVKGYGIKWNLTRKSWQNQINLKHHYFVPHFTNIRLVCPIRPCVYKLWHRGLNKYTRMICDDSMCSAKLKRIVFIRNNHWIVT